MLGIFITGTDVGVGKTVVAAGLAAMLREAGRKVGVFKPVQTGWSGEEGEPPPDAVLLAAAAGCSRPGEVSPYIFAEPLSPLVAALRAGEHVQLARLDDAWGRLQGHDVVLVEGAGGLAVPVTDRLDMAGLALHWGLPLLIVSRGGLGTLNHIYLTVHYARSRNLPVVGVVLCARQQTPDNVILETQPPMITEMCGVPVLGVVPPWKPQPSVEDAVAAVSTGLPLERFLEACETTPGGRP